MRSISKEGTWLSDVSEYEISDIAKAEFNIFAPSVSKHRTIVGSEYFKIDGLKIERGGKTKRAILYLNHFGPIRVREDGKVVTDLTKIVASSKDEVEEGMNITEIYSQLLSQKEQLTINKNFGVQITDDYKTNRHKLSTHLCVHTLLEFGSCI